MKTDITFINCPSKIKNDFILLITGLTDNYELSNNSNYIELRWVDCKKIIAQILKVLKESSVNIEIDTFTQELFNRYLEDRKYISLEKKFLEITEAELHNILSKNHFNRILTSEQTRDTLKLLSIKNGANFSVPGAGKTTTILAVFTVLKHFSIANKLFVVSPINAFISWEDEIKYIFNDTYKVLRLNKMQVTSLGELITEDSEVFLINYEKLRDDIDGLVQFFSNNETHFVLDESHKIKAGDNNLSYPQIASLGELAVRRDILTGTPMPQSLNDLYPQFEFIWSSKKLLPKLSNLNNDLETLQIVNSTIKDYYVRTTKAELHLSSPIISEVNIELGPIQSEIYRLIKSDIARIMSGMDREKLSYYRNLAKSFIKLLQASTNPMLLTSSDDYEEDIQDISKDTAIWELLEDYAQYEKPAKIEYLRNKVKELVESGKKVLVWTYFIRNIALLENLLSNYNPVSIYGAISSGSDTDINTREGRIRKFHEDDSCKVLIGNPQACGEGISLHRVCHNAIYLDRNFNAAYYLQSLDRIHRLGLEKNTNTFIEILSSKDTIDEKITDRLNEKIRNMGIVLDDYSLSQIAYDPSDLDDSNIMIQSGIDEKDIKIIEKHVREDV